MLINLNNCLQRWDSRDGTSLRDWASHSPNPSGISSPTVLEFPFPACFALIYRSLYVLSSFHPYLGYVPSDMFRHFRLQFHLRQGSVSFRAKTTTRAHCILTITMSKKSPIEREQSIMERIWNEDRTIDDGPIRWARKVQWNMNGTKTKRDGPLPSTETKVIMGCVQCRGCCELGVSLCCSKPYFLQVGILRGAQRPLEQYLRKQRTC